MWWAIWMACAWVSRSEHEARLAANDDPDVIPDTDTDSDASVDTDTDTSVDTDTDTDTECGEVEICGNGLDDDCDGHVDCRPTGTTPTPGVTWTDAYDAIGTDLAWVRPAAGPVVLVTADPDAAFGLTLPWTGARTTAAADATVPLVGAANARVWSGSPGAGDLLVTWDVKPSDAGALWRLAWPTATPTLRVTGGAKEALGAPAPDGIGAAGLGDADGDGRADLAVAAEGAGEGGAVWLFDGAAGGTLTSADHDGAWRGKRGARALAGDVRALGDVDADGYTDLLLREGSGDRWVARGAAAWPDALAEAAPLRVMGITGPIAACPGGVWVAATADGAAALPLDGVGAIDAADTATATDVAGASWLACGAFDGDAPDLAIARDTWVDVAFGPLAAPDVDWRLGVGATRIDAADIDGDGVDDVVVATGTSVVGFLGAAP